MQSIKILDKKLLLIVFVILLVALTGCNADADADLMVTSVEVTQAIQSPTNSITLVANRSTAVRATLGIVSGTAPVTGVTGRLHVFVNGSEITPAAGVPAINEPFSAPASPQRANQNDTLNFELPAPSGITASADVDFRVDITVPGDPDTTNNSGSANNLTAVARTTPSLYFTRIDYIPSGLGLPALADVQPGVGDAFVRGIYPVDDSDPNLYRQGLFPTLPFNGDSNGNGILDSSPEGNDLLAFLASCRQLIVDAGLGANNNTFLYGWIAGNPISGNGLGQVGGFNAYGNTELIRHQRTYAHELGHNFGLDHNSRMLDEIGWDVGARLDGNPAGNNTTGWVKPLTLNDIMRGGQLTNSAWVDTITYNFFLSSPVLAYVYPDGIPDKGMLMSVTSQQEEEFSARVAVIQGIISPEGNELLSLQPVFRYPWPSQPISREQSGRFLAEVIDEAGNVTMAMFNAQVADDSGEEGEEQFGFFEVMVPVTPDFEIVSVRIIDGQSNQVLGSFERSESPEISIISPTDGEQLGEQTEVAWEVEDSDTPLEELMYQLSYSPDGGRTWVPIAVNVPGSERSIVFNSTEIQASDGNGIIRVFVSDGLNTVFADVMELSTLAAQY